MTILGMYGADRIQLVQSGHAELDTALARRRKKKQA
jgi:hypothetical protein